MKESLFQIILRNFITIYYFIDILVSFNTGYMDKNELVLDRKLIAQNYFRFWFWIDLLATIPYELILSLI